MVKVAVVRCENYEYSSVLDAVERGISLIGGAESFVKAGEKILLKPNLLTSETPEKCVTTHPSVFKAVAEVILRQEVKLSYGDSPAMVTPEAAARVSGIAAAAEELEIPMADFNKGEEVYFEEGIQNKKLTLARGVLESDGLVSIAKLKTHAFAKMTGAIKNQFGCVPGKLKGEFHVKLPDVNEFSKMLVDINRYIKPRLYVMDGIMAMEGNGPRGGTPKRMNLLLFSSDPVALDATVCRIVRLNPEFVPTTVHGMEGGLGTHRSDEIDLVGDPIDSFIDETYDVKREPLKPFRKFAVLRHIRNIVLPKPNINLEKCVKCGVCVQMCPVEGKAVNWRNGDRTNPPQYEYGKCIRCFCCQELCPESAIDVKVPFVRRMLK